MPVTSELANIPPLTDTPTQTEAEIESRLTEEICSLWAAHQETNTAAKRTKDELKVVKRDLAEKLHAMKSLLTRTGRGGWSGYLRSQKLPRATADRYVSRHESLLIPPAEKRLSEAITETTEDGIRRLVRSLLPKLRPLLTSRDWVDWSAEEVALQLNV